MRYVLALFISLFATTAFAQTHQPDDAKREMRFPANNGYFLYPVPHPPAKAGGLYEDGIVYYDGSTPLERMALFGPGIYVTHALPHSTLNIAPDWSQIVNKPTTLSAYGITDAYSSSNPSGYVSASALTGYATSADLTAGLATKDAAGSAATVQAYAIQRANHTGTQAISTVSGLQAALDAKAVPGTTLAGYGITDAYPLSGNPSGFLVSSDLSAYLSSATAASTYATQSALALKLAIPAGTTSQVVLGDGTLGALPVVPTPSINDAPGRSLVTSTSDTGFQVSANRPARVCYEGTFSTTSTIGGPAGVSVFLETADTNSTTPGDWTIKARQTNSNTITLAIALNQVDVEPWSFCRLIPAGKYVRIRSGSITGTASASINTEQQEVTE